MTQENKIPENISERKTWLNKPENRDPIVRNGAGSIYYAGDKKSLSDIFIIVSYRSAKCGGGLAHFGGLGEDCDLVEGDKIATGINNARREGQEEMEEILGYEPALDTNKYQFLFAARDDGFIINNGRGFPVNARLHSYEMEPELVEALLPNGALTRDRDPEQGGPIETDKIEKVSFTDALTRQDEYHYAHEYFSLWVMAAKELKQDVIKIANDLNKQSKSIAVDFQKVADKMHCDLDTLEQALGQEYKGKIKQYQQSLKP